MKKIALRILFGSMVFFAGTLAFAAPSFAAISVTPSSGSSGYLLTHTVSVVFDNSSFIRVTNPAGADCKVDDPSYGGFNTVNMGVGSLPDINYFPSIHTHCSPTFSTPSFWTPDGTYIFRMYSDSAMTTLVDTGTFLQSSPPPPSGIQSWLDNASSSFYATTDPFSVSDIVTWMANALLLPFIGMGLLVLMLLKWWIVGLVVLSAIVYFAFRGLGFFKH